MFVKNKENVDFKYRKGSYLVVLKANTVTQVDDTKVSAKELIDCYGQRIKVISHDVVEEVTPQAKKEYKVEIVKGVDTVKKDELDDSFIEKVLEEIKEEDNSNADTDTDTDVDTDTDTDTDADTDTDDDTDTDTDADVDADTDTEKEPQPSAAPKVKATRARGRRRSKKN